MPSSIRSDYWNEKIRVERMRTTLIHWLILNVTLQVRFILLQWCNRGGIVRYLLHTCTLKIKFLCSRFTSTLRLRFIINFLSMTLFRYYQSLTHHHLQMSGVAITIDNNNAEETRSAVTTKNQEEHDRCFTTENYKMVLPRLKCLNIRKRSCPRMIKMKI